MPLLYSLVTGTGAHPQHRVSVVDQFYEIPLFRGALSVMLLLGVGFFPRELGDGPTEDVAALVALEALILLVGLFIWLMALAGFMASLRPPEGPDGMITVASRPRRREVALSWAGLALAAIAIPIAGAAFADPVHVVVLLLASAAALLGLTVVVILPGGSRRRVAHEGGVSVSVQGVRVTSPSHEDVNLEIFPTSADERRSETEIHDALDRIEGLCASDVQWHPGAREAMQRWMTEGFVPTLDETRTLGLDPVWSPDPRSQEPAPAMRRSISALYGVAAFLVACIGTFLAIALIETGSLYDGTWFLPVGVGVIAAAVTAFLVIRAVRASRPVRHDAGVSDRGWFDVLHGRGLIPFEQLSSIRSSEHGLEVQLVSDTLTYPPFEGTAACARRAARDFDVDYERQHRSA